MLMRAATKGLYELSRRHRRPLGSAHELAYHRRILSMRPDHVGSLRRAARLRQDRGDTEIATALWRRLVALEPRRAEAWASLAWLRLGAGDRDEALELSLQGLAQAKDDGSLFQRRELLRSLEAHLNRPEPSSSLRRVSIGGVSHCGSTLIGGLLGSLPGAGNVGESNWLTRLHEGASRPIDFDLDRDRVVPWCRRCGAECPVWTWEFRRALAAQPVDWYEQLAARLGVALLISSEKNHAKLVQLDPLLRTDVVVVYRDPAPVWASTRDRPRNKKGLDEFLLAYEREYLRLLHDLPVEGRKIVLHFDRFRLAPDPIFDRLTSALELPTSGDAAAMSEEQHTLGGSRRGNQTIRGAIQGIVPQGPVDLPTDEAKTIARYAARSPALAQLAAEHERVFGA